ncbi:MAG: hypothetical protein HRU27_20060, partial [Rhizobiaceae bacterium]|nr:hypothetical protein [Rhizobiaceae bacterium]
MVESHSPIERYAKLKTAQPKVRNREAAQTLGLSEAELLFALTTYGDVQQLRGSGAEFAGLLRGLGKAGQLMIFTRNDSAVHEKFGTYKHALIEGGQVCIKHGQ